MVSHSVLLFCSSSSSPTCRCLLEQRVRLCQQRTQLSEEWWNYISGLGKWRAEGIERQSGKEGESILCPSGARGNSIRLIIEPFFTSFYISLLYNSSSCPFLSPLSFLKMVHHEFGSSHFYLENPSPFSELLFLCTVPYLSPLDNSLPSFISLPYDVNKTWDKTCDLKNMGQKVIKCQVHLALCRLP